MDVSSVVGPPLGAGDVDELAAVVVPGTVEKKEKSSIPSPARPHH